MNEPASWSRRQFGRFAREPFAASPLFFVLVILLLIDLAYGAWVVDRFWGAFSNHARFLIIFVLATSPLILYGAVQQQRHVRRSQLDGDAVTPILAVTFAIAAWGYALIGIVLRLLLGMASPQG